MKILFVHQNFPGQYKHIAPFLSRDPANQVASISKRPEVSYPRIKRMLYELDTEPNPGAHPFVERFEEAVKYGQAAAGAAEQLKKEGFIPDIICAHPGWGETLYLRDIFPDSLQFHFCEFYFHAFEGVNAFESRGQNRLGNVLRSRMRNLVHLFSLEAFDWGQAPTRWQHSQFPIEYQPRISVIHDGIDLKICAPKADATYEVKPGLTLSAKDEVVTYCSRNLEPSRGFPTFMKTAAELLERRPNTHILVLGGDEVSYGPKPPEGQTFREIYTKDLDLDPERMHFLGKVPYVKYLDILRISSAHVYLTVPFVLSWSMIEAMACECLVVGSDTKPVLEVITDGHNGLLVDFFDHKAVADRVEEALDHPDKMQAIRRQARLSVKEQYNLADCLKAQINLIKGLVERRDKDQPLAAVR